MKCNHCNAEVAEGTKFCPECGNRIEQPQPLKCPQCNTIVDEGINFCPECGSPIAPPKPTICSKCGTEIEEGEKFCSNCGTPVFVSSTSQSGTTNNISQSGSTLRLCWDGERKQPVWNNPIFVYVNNQKCAEFLPKEKFEKTFTNESSNIEIQLEYGKGPFNKTSIKFDLEKKQNYTCVFFQNAAGTFGYELNDESGRLIKEDGNINLWQIVAFLLIPLVGFIYFFMKKDVQPIAAKMGLLMGFANIVFAILKLLI